MASSKDYLDFILDQLSGLEELLNAMYKELPAPKKKKK